MVKQGGGGAIVNMSSVNAVMAIPNQVPYVVSKGAINQLTKVMALSLAPHGIRVNGIGPGTILTELAKTAVLGNREAERKILSRTPMGRMGEPAEIASVAVFLASDEASYLTGPDHLPGRRAPRPQLHRRGPGLKSAVPVKFAASQSKESPMKRIALAARARSRRHARRRRRPSRRARTAARPRSIPAACGSDTQKRTFDKAYKAYDKCVRALRRGAQGRASRPTRTPRKRPSTTSTSWSRR